MTQADAGARGQQSEDAGFREAPNEAGDPPGASTPARDSGCSVTRTGDAGWLLALVTVLMLRRRKRVASARH